VEKMEITKQDFDIIDGNRLTEEGISQVFICKLCEADENDRPFHCLPANYSRNAGRPVFVFLREDDMWKQERISDSEHILNHHDYYDEPTPPTAAIRMVNEYTIKLQKTYDELSETDTSLHRLRDKMNTSGSKNTHGQIMYDLWNQDKLQIPLSRITQQSLPSSEPVSESARTTEDTPAPAPAPDVSNN